MLVMADRSEEEEPDGAPNPNLLVRELTGDNDRIGEQNTAARTQNSIPVLQHGQTVRQVIDRVIAEDNVERLVLKRKTPAGVDHVEGNDRRESFALSPAFRRFDAVEIDVDSGACRS